MGNGVMGLKKAVYKFTSQGQHKPAKMTPSRQHLCKALELIKEEARLARYDWEDTLERSRTAQRLEAQAREKYLALNATVHVLEEATKQTQTAAEPSQDRVSLSLAGTAAGAATGSPVLLLLWLLKFDVWAEWLRHRRREHRN